METLSKGISKIQFILKLSFGIVPIVAGLDKFFNLLADWPSYLNPTLVSMLPFSGQTFMYIVGVVEILAGVLVLTKTQLGATIVALWLTLVALSLLVSGRYLDVAVRDLVMALGAYMLVRITALLKNNFPEA